MPLESLWNVFGFLCCVLGYGAWMYSSLTTQRGRRTVLACMVLLTLLGGVSLYASEQTVLNPCSQCATAEGWLYWVLGCWACP